MEPRGRLQEQAMAAYSSWADIVAQRKDSPMDQRALLWSPFSLLPEGFPHPILRLHLLRLRVQLSPLGPKRLYQNLDTCLWVSYDGTWSRARYR